MKMEAAFRSDVFALDKMLASFMESLVVQTALVLQDSLISLLMAMEYLSNDVCLLPKLLPTDMRFPLADLYKRQQPDTENKDGSETEDDDDDDDNTGDQDDDDEDFEGEEGNDDDDDEEGDPEDDVEANGAGGNDDDDEDEDDDDDDDDDEDGEDEDEDEDEDDEETAQPPAKKRK